MANVYNITIEQGSTFDLNLTVKNSDGTPVNLTSYSVSGGIKYGYGSNSYLANLNAVITGAVSGIINISLPASTTSNLPVTKAVYDIEAYIPANGYTFKAIRGYVDILPEVTNL